MSPRPGCDAGARDRSSAPDRRGPRRRRSPCLAGGHPARRRAVRPALPRARAGLGAGEPGDRGAGRGRPPGQGARDEPVRHRRSRGSGAGPERARGRPQRVDHPGRRDPGPARPGRVRVLLLPTPTSPPPASRPRPTSTQGDVAARTTLGAYPPFLYPVVGWAASPRQRPAQRHAARPARRAGGLRGPAVAGLLAPGAMARGAQPRRRRGAAHADGGVLPGDPQHQRRSRSSVPPGWPRSWRCTPVAPSRSAHTATQAVVLVSGTALVLSRQLGIVTMAVLTAAAAVPRRLARRVGRAAGRGARSPGPPCSSRPCRRSPSACGSCATTTPCCSGLGLSADSFRGFREQWMQLIQESVGWFGWLDVRPPVRGQPRLVRRGRRAGRHRARPRRPPRPRGPPRDGARRPAGLLRDVLAGLLPHQRGPPGPARAADRRAGPDLVRRRRRRAAPAARLRASPCGVAAVLLPLVVLVGPLPQRQAVCGGSGLRSRVVRPRRPVDAATRVVSLAGARRSVAASFSGSRGSVSWAGVRVGSGAAR